MNVGYILLYRSFFENDFLYGDGHKFNKPEIWLWLLVYARWQDSPRSFLIRGNKVTINRGELAISEEELADTWHWSRPSIIKFLKEFEAENMIDVKRSRVINVIRIVNYERYQLNFLQQNLQQSLQQEKSCLQQEEPIQTNDVDENCINSLQQNLQQSLQQNLQQSLQPINNSIINNTSSSRIVENQNFSSLIDVVEFVKMKKQPEALLRLSELMLIKQDELIKVLDEFAVANVDGEKRTLKVWGKYFQACKDSIIARMRNNNNQKPKQHNDEKIRDRCRGFETKAKTADDYYKSF